jgi:predicted dehydrogenase
LGGSTISACSTWRATEKPEARARRDKGHAREIQVTVEAIRGGDPAPIPFEELMEVSAATLAVEEAIATGKPVWLRGTEPVGFGA